MPDAIEPGRVLGGRYRLDQLIARGGMGTVWEAEDPLLSRTVAVKVLDPVLASDEKLRARFRREAVSAAAVAHPNIVATYDTGDDDGTAYIVMELVHGRTLRRVIDEMGPLPIPMAADIAYQVADALSTAHARGLVHRDVKPGNVLVQADGRAKVTDFGIVKATDSTGDELTRSGMVVGTARYLAPEQVDGSGVDERADVYSLGLVLYEMLVGKAPFEGDTDIATAVARLTTPPRDITLERPDVPSGLAHIIDGALERDPQHRIPSAAAFRDAVSTYRREDNYSHERTMPVTRPVTRPVVPRPAPVAPSGQTAVVTTTSAGTSAVMRAVLWILAFAIGVAAGYFVYQALDDTSSGATTTTTTTAKPGPLQILGINDFDPEGDDGQEDHEHVGSAIDGNEATFWATTRYKGSRNFGNSKAGVGLILDLGTAKKVSAVQADSPDVDWSASVYVRDVPGATLAEWGQALANGQGLGNQAQLQLTTPTSGRYVLFWMTRLPETLKLRISEVRVIGTA